MAPIKRTLLIAFDTYAVERFNCKAFRTCFYFNVSLLYHIVGKVSMITLKKKELIAFSGPQNVEISIIFRISGGLWKWKYQGHCCPITPSRTWDKSSFMLINPMDTVNNCTWSMTFYRTGLSKQWRIHWLSKLWIVFFLNTVREFSIPYYCTCFPAKVVAIQYFTRVK